MTTARQARNSRFQIGSAVFTCMGCGIRTRDTGDGVDHLCHDCFELAGWDNHHNDNGTKPTEAEMANYIGHLKSIASKGGDIVKVVNMNDYAFPEGVPPAAQAFNKKAKGVKTPQVSALPGVTPLGLPEAKAPKAAPAPKKAAETLEQRDARLRYQAAQQSYKAAVARAVAAEEKLAEALKEYNLVK